MLANIDLASAAAAELLPWLASEGFGQHTTSRPTVVQFDRPDHVVLQLEYYPEDAPPRSIGIALGLREQDGTMRGVGAWELMSDTASRQYSQFRFTSQDDLHETLRHLRAQALPALVPYWQDTARLLVAIETSESRRQASFDEAEDQRRLAAARRAFDAGRFDESIRQYALAGGARTLADDQRLKIARRKVALD